MILNLLYMIGVHESYLFGLILDTHNDYDDHDDH